MRIRDYHMRHLLHQYCQRLNQWQGQDAVEDAENGGDVDRRAFTGKRKGSGAFGERVVQKAYESACGAWDSAGETGDLVENQP